MRHLPQAGALRQGKRPTVVLLKSFDNDNLSVISLPQRIIFNHSNAVHRMMSGAYSEVARRAREELESGEGGGREGGGTG